MKKNIRLIAILSSTVASLGVALTGAFSWFMTTIKINNITGTGVTDSAYFAYGTGTAEDPFGITDTRHLNNLAWLQYNGQFDDDHYYFELADNVNENGSTYVIPPIGTEEHPFIGVFNGNGYTINNVKITNNSSSFSDKPENITYTQNNAEIIGFFGVVGALDIEDTYSSQVNNIVDFTLDNFEVESVTENTLIGLAAGYVNADMSGVKVGTSTITVNGNAAKATYTDKLSDYGLVGYTTRTGSSGTFEQKVSKYYDNSSQGFDPGWGGSIVIKDLYNRLTTIRSTYAIQNQTLPTSYNDVYDSNDNLISHTQYNNSTQASFDVYNEDYRKNNATYDEKIGAVKMSYGSAGIYYLDGGHYTTAKNSEYYTHSGSPIQYGTNYLQFDLSATNNWKNEVSPEKPTLWNIPAAGSTGNITTTYNNQTYYLQNDSGTLKVATSSSTSTQWTISSDSPNLKATNNSKTLDYSDGWVLKGNVYYTLSYTSGGTTYYFKANGAGQNVTTTTSLSEASKWDYSSNKYSLLGISSSNLGITCTRTSSGGWITSYTLNVNQPAVAGASGSYVGDYTFSGGQGSTSGTNGTFSSSVSGSGVFGIGSTTFYLTFSGSSLSAGTSSGSTFTATQRTDTSTVITKGSNISDQVGPDYYTTTNKFSGMDYSYQDVTYIPINVNSSYQADTNNTGYIVGGLSYTSPTDTGTGGNVRIASFYTLSNDLTNYNTTKKCFNEDSVWTVDSSGLHTIDDDNNTFVKYTESKGKIEQNLGTSSNIYGLHFMSAAISTDSLVKAKYAQINGSEYDDYYMPANSIDFNLRDQGYINFFAAPYGRVSGSNGNSVETTVDSFFSLHQIKRNGTSIDEINEIEEIYSDGKLNHAYVYKLSNGNFTVPYSIDKYNSSKLYILDTKTPITDVEHGGYADGIYHELTATEFNNQYASTFTKVFDMGWLKDNSYSQGDNGFHQGFYFEIPANPGEYALGTVANKSFGAYLMYLDIGANAANQDKITAYAITTEQSGLQYPLGVDFNSSDVTGDDGGETFGIIIFAGTDSDGDVSFTVSGTTITYDSDFTTKYSYSEKSASGTSPPQAPDLPPANGTRVIYGHIVGADNSEWEIRVTEVLDAQGEVTSSTYTSVVCDGVTLTAEDVPESFILNSIRPVVAQDVVTLTRVTGDNAFNAVPTYSGQDYTTVNISIVADGISVEVHDILTGYSILVNNTAITTDPQVYPAA